jgi:hypothetical protein
MLAGPHSSHATVGGQSAVEVEQIEPAVGGENGRRGVELHSVLSGMS